jgi:transcription antitermination factor NusG
MRRAPHTYSYEPPTVICNRARFVSEMQRLLDHLAVNLDLGLCPPLEAGQRVQIVRGPFRGSVGEIESHAAKAGGVVRVVIRMTEPKLYWPVEVAADEIERLS